MGNFYSFLKKKSINEPVNTNNIPFIKNNLINNSSVIDVKDIDDTIEPPSYSQV